MSCSGLDEDALPCLKWIRRCSGMTIGRWIWRGMDELLPWFWTASAWIVAGLV
ncbi:hypothetical protein ACLOJK_030063 [Asimina triloba]